jgi:type II secretory pathway pseudopilin PulG
MRIDPLPIRAVGHRRAAAFTMVEIALCIAIVAIAMVAIMGVMPTGLSVQKQNLEDTIIDQEAQILMDTLRSGSVRFDELTNYVDYIVVSHQPTGIGTAIRSNSFRGNFFSWPVNSPLAGIDAGGNRTLIAEDIVGLLSQPKLDVYRDRFGTNKVVAQFRAFSGPLQEKIRPAINGTTRTDQIDFAFRYQVTAEINLVPFGPDSTDAHVGRDFNQRSVFDVRLTFRWPAYLSAGEYRVGNNAKTYSTQVSAQPREYFLPGGRSSEIYTSGILRRRLNASSMVLQ